MCIERPGRKFKISLRSAVFKPTVVLNGIAITVVITKTLVRYNAKIRFYSIEVGVILIHARFLKGNES